MPKLSNFIYSILALPLIISPAYAKEYPIDESMQKGMTLLVPEEFKNGTASLEDVKGWMASLDSNTPTTIKYMNLDKDKEPEVLASFCNANDNHCDFAFSKEKSGYRYLGKLFYGSIRVITYPDSPISYLISFGHISAGETEVSLQLLQDKKISPSYKIKPSLLKDGILREQDEKLQHKLSAENIPEKELRGMFDERPMAE